MPLGAAKSDNIGLLYIVTLNCTQYIGHKCHSGFILILTGVLFPQPKEREERVPLTIRIVSITENVLHFIEMQFVSDGLEWNLQVQSRYKAVVDPVNDSVSAVKSY